MMAENYRLDNESVRTNRICNENTEQAHSSSGYFHEDSQSSEGIILHRDQVVRQETKDRYLVLQAYHILISRPLFGEHNICLPGRGSMISFAFASHLLRA